MRFFLTAICVVWVSVACQSSKLGFISENRQEVTIGYMKYADNTRRSEGNKETDADLAFNAGVDFINSSKIFPFRIKVKTITFDDITPQGMQKNVALFSDNSSQVAAWIASKSTGINLAVSPASLQSRVPVFFPITSKSLFTQGYPNLYQLTPSNSLFGIKTWDLARSMNLKKILLIEDSSIIYSGEYAQAFLNKNQVHNNSIDVTEIIGNFPETQATMLDEIRDALKTGQYDAVFFPGYANDIRTVMSLTEELGLSIPMLAGDEGGDPTVFEKLKGMSSIYYLAYFPVETKVEDNPKTRINIEAFKRFYQTSGEGLMVSQFYFSSVLLVANIISSVLAENPVIATKEAFYDLFNNTAKTKSFLALSDFPIQMQADGTLLINEGELNISKNSLKAGIVNTGRI